MLLLLGEMARPKKSTWPARKNNSKNSGYFFFLNFQNIKFVVYIDSIFLGGEGSVEKT